VQGKERWYATISVFNELKYLGQFASEIEAARAYDRAALEYRGNKAQLNFTAGVHAVIPGVECGLKLVQITNAPIADSVVFYHVQVRVCSVLR
jgi:hypothetical protein